MEVSGITTLFLSYLSLKCRKEKHPLKAEKEPEKMVVAGEVKDRESKEGGGLSFGIDGNRAWLMLLFSFGIPGSISHWNGIEPGFLKDSSIIITFLFYFIFLV